MTYQEKFAELQTEFALKGDTYIRAEKELSSITGWGDSMELTAFLNAKKEFEEAGNAYHNFLTYVRDNKIDPQQPYRGI